MRNIEKLEKFAKTLMVIGAIMIFIGLIGIIIKHASAKDHYHVTDQNGDTYITHYIYYMGDCIVFYDDENDIEHKLCSDYEIEKI